MVIVLPIASRLGAALAAICKSDNVEFGSTLLSYFRIQQDKEAAYHAIGGAPMVETAEPVVKESMTTNGTEVPAQV